jgi:carbon-monoxide dehydrogenase medium subunit
MGVGDQPVRAGEAETSLAGADPSTETFAAAAEEATRDLRPASEVHGSSHYRRHLARVTVRRALEAAAAKAGGS